MSITQAWVDFDLKSTFSVGFDVLLATTEKFCCQSLWLLQSPTHPSTHDLVGHISVLCQMSHQPASGWMCASCSQTQASPPTDIKHDRENENGYLHVTTFSRKTELAICVPSLHCTVETGKYQCRMKDVLNSFMHKHTSFWECCDSTGTQVFPK